MSNKGIKSKIKKFFTIHLPLDWIYEYLGSNIFYNTTMKFKKERKELISFAKKIYKKGLVSGVSGNLSLRVDEKAFLITPASKSYEKLQIEDLVLLDMEGNIIEGQKEPSSEKKLHIEIYKNREDVGAIIHTHSVFTCVLAALEMSLPMILEEQQEILGGEIKVAKYAPAGSETLAKEAIKAIGTNKAVILAKHGLVSVGENMDEAYLVCNLIERLSKIYLYMRLLTK